MEDLPVNAAVTENDKDKIIRFEGKSVKSRQDGEMVLFQIKISSETNIKLEELLKGNNLRTLKEIIRRMQLLHNDCHLCEQHSHKSDADVCSEQRNYIVKSQSDEVEVITVHLSKSFPFTNNWYFRIYQKKIHFMKECAQVYRMMQKLKVFNPRINLEYHLKMDGVMTQETLSGGMVKVGVQTMMLTPLLLDKKSKHSRKLQCKTGVTMTITWHDEITEMQSALKLSCVGLYLPFQLQSDFSYVHFTSFGPQGIPLNLKSCQLDIVELVNWESYGFQPVICDDPLSCDKIQGIVYPDYTLKLKGLQEEDGSRPNRCHLVLYLCIDTVHDLGCEETLEILRMLKTGIQVLFNSQKTDVQEVFTSVTDKIFEERTKLCKQKQILDMALATLKDSVSSIILQSGNSDFKQKCFNYLEVDSLTEFQRVLGEKLLETSALHIKSCPSTCSSNLRGFENPSFQQLGFYVEERESFGSANSIDDGACVDSWGEVTKQENIDEKWADVSLNSTDWSLWHHT